MKQFWNLEAIGIKPQVERQLTPEKLAVNRVDESMKLSGERHEGAVPWKQEEPHLPSNQQMAETLFYSVEKKLM